MSARSWSPLLAVALVIGVTTSGGAAMAQPTVWEKARNPELEAAYDILSVVEGKLLRVQISNPFDLLERHRTYRAIVALLDANNAIDLPDARLKFLVADVYAESAVGRYAEARDAVNRALAEAPDSPQAGGAWFMLGVICAKLDEPDCENHAYSRALEVVFDRDFRSNIYLNRGESNMVVGDLEAAVRDYREAVRLATRQDLISLSYYGLGIALERSGDLPSALQAMRRARANWPALAPYTALDQPSVFFVPKYDLFYYKALESMALAQMAARDRDYEREQNHLRDAIDNWSTYLKSAEPAQHEYATNAKLHRANCRRDLNRSMARAAGRLGPRRGTMGLGY